MERPESTGDTGACGGRSYATTEEFSSDDELMGNPSGHRSPIGPV